MTDARSERDAPEASAVIAEAQAGALRRVRLARCFAAMDAHDVDALVLSREGNVRYASGARRLWLAGPRAFGPGCVLVRATRAVHLLATSDAGVPADVVPRAHLYPLTWSPDALAAHLARIAGLAESSTIGVDGWNAAAGRLLARVAPSARVVDGDALLRGVRAVKLPAEIEAIRAAVAIATQGLAAVRAALAEGASEPALRAALLARVASLGATVPAHDAVRLSDVRPPLVGLRCGVLLDGYEGTLARTVARPGAPPAAEHQDLVRRGGALRAALIAACRSGASAADLFAAYAASGEPLPPGAIVHGSGLGAEPPLVSDAHACDPSWRLSGGAVLAVHARIGDAFATQDLVHVAASGPVCLTDVPLELGAT